MTEPGVEPPRVSMKKYRKAWIHIAAWGLLILYLVISPKIEVRYFLTQGKPVDLPNVLLEDSGLISYSIDKTNEVTLRGEKVNKVWGWSFLTTATDQADYDIYLVLANHQHTLFYPTQSSKRADLPKAFPDAQSDLLHAGFFTYVAEAPLRLGSYQVGLLYVDKTSGETYYQPTNRLLVRTPNTLRLESQEID